GALFVITGEGSQTSAAVAPFRKARIAGSLAGVPPNWEHSTVIPAGQTMAGGAVATTRTSAEHVRRFPSSSRALNVTEVVPVGKSAGALLVIVGAGSQVSLAVAPPRNAAIAGFVAGVPPCCEHSTVTGAGHAMDGAV